MIKKIKLWIPILLIGVFFISLFIGRPYLLNLISQSQRDQLSKNKQISIKNSIDASYNYSANREGYSYTFFEFGSTGCSACKNMGKVMEQIRTKYLNRVNVVFVNVMEKSNKDLINYFGIATIPTQVLLDTNGNEFYRHTGYISEIDLEKHFK